MLELRAIDEEMLPVGAEVPAPVTSLVDVVVLDGVVDPPLAVGTAVLDLGLAVHDTGGRFAVVGQHDVVGADVQSDAHRAECVGHQLVKTIATRERRADADVRYIELHQRAMSFASVKKA